MYASGRPVSSFRSVEVLFCCTATSRSVTDSIAACASAMVASSTPVRTPASISRRTASVNGRYTAS